MTDTSLGQMFFDRARAHENTTAFRVRRGGAFVDIPYSEAARRVEAVAAGLLTCPGGLARRTSVGIIGNTSMEWVVADLAALALDAVVTPVYPTLLAPEVGYILADASVEVVIVADKVQLEKVRSSAGGFTFFDTTYGREALRVRHHVVIDPSGLEAGADWESLAALEARGRAELDATRAERADRARSVTRESVATYSYTSGTTGQPKGVILTHHNWLSMLEVSNDFGLFTDQTRESGAMLFLPLAHSFGRLIELAAIFHGGPLVFSSAETLGEDLVLSRPGLFPAAPRVYEKIYARIMSAVAGAPAHRRRLFTWALSVGRATIPYRQQRKPMPVGLRLEAQLADRLVFAKLRRRLGLDRIETMLSGSAPLASAMHEFFVAAGLMLYEGYGLTETCPALTLNAPGRWRLGTVGPPLRNVQLKIAADGEILAKGPNVTQGYLNRPDANAEAFDADGWFRTGDVGELEPDGMLRITDRKKDLLKTSGGKYVAPQKIEGMLKSRPLILEAVVVGDAKRHCTALLMLDDDGWRQWAGQREKAMDPRDPELLSMLQASIDAVNRDLASFESIKAFRVLDAPLTVESGLLTASFKVKRKEVNKRFAHLIDEMYGASAQQRTS